VEGQLRALVLRTSDWPIGILALLGIDFGKHSTKSQNIKKDPNGTSADVLFRCHSREIDLVIAVSHRTSIEDPSGAGLSHQSSWDVVACGLWYSASSGEGRDEIV
jgi:hypothetical protein